MPLLALPLLLIALVLLWVLLLPVLMVQRYRLGRARHRAIGWVVRTNAWLLLGSALMLLCGAWISGHWVPHALPFTAVGLLAGGLLGVAGILRSRFETSPNSFHYTPDRWVVLLLTGLAAARLLLALWQTSQRIRANADAVGWMADAGSLFAIGGMLLGYYLVYGWGLRRRFHAWRTAP